MPGACSAPDSVRSVRCARMPPSLAPLIQGADDQVAHPVDRQQLAQ